MRVKSLLIVFFGVFATCHQAKANSDWVSVFVAPFSGDNSLGRNVSTILYLQTLGTLRAESATVGATSDFGHAGVFWDNHVDLPQDHVQAANLAAQHRAQFCVWGKALKFGDGVAIQAYLSYSTDADKREHHPENWQITIKRGSREGVVTVELPSSNIEFPPIYMPETSVDKYQSIESLKMYEDRNTHKPIGVVGDDIEPLEHDGDFSKITSHNRKGWVFLPELGATSNAIESYVGGVVRLFRGDFAGAVELLQSVKSSGSLSTNLQIETDLLLVLAKQKQGVSAETELNEAERLNPYLAITIKYSVMNSLAILQRGIEKNDVESMHVQISTIRQKIEKNRLLFSEGDPWLENVMHTLTLLD